MQTISSVSQCCDRDIIRSLMKTLWRFSCSVQQMQFPSLWSHSHGWLRRTICYCLAEPRPLWTQSKGSFFLWKHPIISGVAMYASGSNYVCVCLCMWGLEQSVCGNCGKAFVCYKRGKMETSAVKQPAVHDCSRLRHTHTHTPDLLVICGDASSWPGKYPRRKGLSACLQHKQHISCHFRLCYACGITKLSFDPEN